MNNAPAIGKLSLHFGLPLGQEWRPVMIMDCFTFGQDKRVVAVLRYEQTRLSLVKYKPLSLRLNVLGDAKFDFAQI